MGFRLDRGGHIDRSQAIHFRWNGRKLTAFAGDTVASALIANDIAVVGLRDRCEIWERDTYRAQRAADRERARTGLADMRTRPRAARLGGAA